MTLSAFHPWPKTFSSPARLVPLPLHKTWTSSTTTPARNQPISATPSPKPTRLHTHIARRNPSLPQHFTPMPAAQPFSQRPKGVAKSQIAVVPSLHNASSGRTQATHRDTGKTPPLLTNSPFTTRRSLSNIAPCAHRSPRYWQSRHSVDQLDQPRQGRR